MKDIDDGIYSVIAESEAGEASCSATIEVEDLQPVSETFKEHDFKMITYKAYKTGIRD